MAARIPGRFKHVFALQWRGRPAARRSLL